MKAKILPLGTVWSTCQTCQGYRWLMYADGSGKPFRCTSCDGQGGWAVQLPAELYPTQGKVR